MTNFFKKYNPFRLRENLTLRHAVDEARNAFQKTGVRHFVIPTPEGVLRIVNSAECQKMISSGFFPKNWKIQDIYSVCFFYTYATKRPKHMNSVESFANLSRYHEWWISTHIPLLIIIISKVARFLHL